jgi:hypothetical protein
MELMAGDVEAFHLGFAHLDAFAVRARVEGAFDFETSLGGVGPDQFDVMWQNCRCSILFHFDVPGG